MFDPRKINIDDIELWLVKFGLKFKKKKSLFCILNVTILSAMVDLVVELNFRFKKFAIFHNVTSLLSFSRAERASGPSTEFEKTVLFFVYR